ncbi:MAG TPA: 2-succinyl-5-enolpyruvyl-6-hydroxy-3-cyclohexene-1-carboxylic-acid synthase [Polyangiaceae bacterium]
MTGAIVGEWARLLFGSLARAGVKDVVVSPGSRSTPFVWAAAATPGLVCHSLYDERSAAFFALGLARVTGEAPLLVCTSGSAAANYFPAVVEASLAHHPLLVMTADRPLELQDAGAPQTIDQVKLYGDFARSFFDLGVPDPAPASLAALVRSVAQAALSAKSPIPGPVHLNARAKKPLEPAEAHTEHELALVSEVDRLLARGVPHAFAARPEPEPQAVAELADRLSRAERGVIVCGPLGLARAAELESIVELARKLDMPVYAEATSQLRFGAFADAKLAVDGLDWVLRTPSFVRAALPELVLQFGGTPVSAGLEQLLSAHATELAIVAEHGFPDPTSSASFLVRGEPASVARAIGERLGGHSPRASQREYTKRLQGASDAASFWVEAVLAKHGDETICEAEAIRRTVRALPGGALLVVGNSLPIRELDWYVPTAPHGVAVACQRGTNGIDGLISGAAGAAVAARKPTVLLVGDVSFAHDLGGLSAARRVETPFVVVVIDNDGGRIFEQLPVARLWTRPELAELWLTPPRLSIADAARAFGVRHAAPTTSSELDAELATALERPGPTIVQVRVAPETTKGQPAEIRKRVAELGERGER